MRQQQMNPVFQSVSRVAPQVPDMELDEALKMTAQVGEAARSAAMSGPQAWQQFSAIYGPRLQEAAPDMDLAMLGYDRSEDIISALSGARDALEQEAVRRRGGGASAYIDRPQVTPNADWREFQHNGQSVKLPPAQYEDSPNAYWDAQKMGNGQGRSFYNVGGETFYPNEPGQPPQGAAPQGNPQLMEFLKQHPDAPPDRIQYLLDNPQLPPSMWPFMIQPPEGSGPQFVPGDPQGDAPTGMRQFQHNGQTINLPPLQYEDGQNGYWDAETMGNGGGRSFYNIDGQRFFMDGAPPSLDAPRAREFQDMPPQEQDRIRRGLEQGVPPEELFNPNGMDLRELIEGQRRGVPGMRPQTAFAPGAEYQTAQTGPLAAMADPYVPQGNAAKTDSEERVMALQNNMGRLGLIFDELQANPELLDSAHTWRGQAANNLLRLRDRAGIPLIDIGPEGEQRLGDVSAYRQTMLTNVNNYIKEITGATVGQGDETRRLMAVQVNPSDSPTQVIAKINNALNIGRMEYLRARMQADAATGGNAPPMTDAQIQERLRQEGAQFYQQAIQSGLSPDQARMQAAQAMRQRYGL